eukprot:3940499-Rhodomonas_salina.1
MQPANSLQTHRHTTFLVSSHRPAQPQPLPEYNSLSLSLLLSINVTRSHTATRDSNSIATALNGQAHVVQLQLCAPPPRLSLLQSASSSYQKSEHPPAPTGVSLLLLLFFCSFFPPSHIFSIITDGAAAGEEEETCVVLCAAHGCRAVASHLRDTALQPPDTPTSLHDSRSIINGLSDLRRSACAPRAQLRVKLWGRAHTVRQEQEGVKDRGTRQKEGWRRKRRKRTVTVRRRKQRRNGRRRRGGRNDAGVGCGKKRC